MLKLKTLMLILTLLVPTQGFARKRAIPPKITDVKFKIDLLIERLKYYNFFSQKDSLQKLIALSSLKKNRETMITYKAIPTLLLILSQKPITKEKIALTSCLLKALIKEYRNKSLQQ